MAALRWSPPSSPDHHDNHIVPTNQRGMITDPTQSPSPSKENGVSRPKRKRRVLQYVSRHFAPPQAEMKKEEGETKRKRRKIDAEKENPEHETSGHAYTAVSERSQRLLKRRGSPPPKLKEFDDAEDQQILVPASGGHKGESNGFQRHLTAQNGDRASGVSKSSESESEPVLPRRPRRIVLGIDIDELSSDSDLTDVPDDIGPDPFLPTKRLTKESKSKKQRQKKKTKVTKVVAVKEPKAVPKSKKTNLTKSPYFPHAHKPRPTFLSTLPFPPLHHATFGLMQERLHRDPFRLLLATIFLNKTPGARAMPVFFRLMERYPTPQALADAEQPNVTEIIQQLGFQNQRARKCIAMAKRWVEDPPVKGRRWRKLGYPVKGDGKDVKEEEVLDDGDQRVAWEISHLPGLGPYSHDSWRMFCRDQLRGLSSGYDGQDSKEGFEPEWKRVLPADKELRAWMTWMWMKEGWVWNKETGERTKASEELMKLASEQGNVVLESENNTLAVRSLDETQPSSSKLDGATKGAIKIDAPAGDFVPQR